MRVTPVGDNILFRRMKQSDVEPKKESKIIMIENKEESFIQVLGEVVAIGDEAMNGCNNIEVAVGSRIIVCPPTATQATISYAYEEDKQEYFLVPYYQILGVIE